MPPLGAVRIGVLVVVMTAHTVPADGGLSLAREALALCHDVVRHPGDDPRTRLTEGLSLAEAAVREAPEDPLAHFAVFCTLGRRVELDGVRLWTLRDVRRLRHEIDAAIALDPTMADALAAKGAFLARLPRLLGGDPEEGARLVRQAADLEPENTEVQRTLATLVSESAARHPELLQ